MLDRSDHDLLLVLLIFQILLPYLKGSLRLAHVASHKVITQLLVCLVLSHFGQLGELIFLLFGDGLKPFKGLLVLLNFFLGHILRLV